MLLSLPWLFNIICTFQFHPWVAILYDEEIEDFDADETDEEEENDETDGEPDNDQYLEDTEL